MPKGRVLLFCLFIAGVVPVFSVPLGELVDTGTAAALAGGENITRTQNKNPRPAMMPRNPRVQRLVDGMIRTLDPSFFVESLSLYKKPDSAALPSWSESERTSLYNAALALSSLAGIRYFSSSRNEMRTFYETSVVINDPAAKRAMEDPSYTAPPSELTIYARQKDLTFGDHVYKYDYYAQDDSLIFIQENLSAMYYGIISAVGKNKLRSMVAIIDAREYILVYAVSMAKAGSFPGLGERIGRSFSTRIEAVMQWFSGQADKAFRKAHS